MNRSYDVLCHFQFVCNQRWESLVPIPGDESKRYCESCKENVHLVSSYSEMATRTAEKHCIAIVHKDEEDLVLEMMGLPRPRVLVRTPDGSINPDLLITISDMELSPPILCRLDDSGIQFLGDLIQLTNRELGALLQDSYDDINQVKEELSSRGYFIGETLDDWAQQSSIYRNPA